LAKQLQENSFFPSKAHANTLQPDNGNIGGLMPPGIGSRHWNSALRALVFVAPVLCVVFSGLPSARGQVLPSPDQLQQLQQMQQVQQLGGRSPLNSGDNQVQSNLVLQPEAPQRSALPQSRLEQIMSQRAGAPLQQFGYDQLGVGRSVTMPQSGAIQSDYVLGVGDELLVSLRGTENIPDSRVAIDRNGQIVLPRLNPLPAAGRSLSAVTQDIQTMVQRAFISTTAFVSVARVRQISVLVSGEVNSPGQRLVTGLSSLVDALLLSGGIRKTGSLRNIRIQRGGREISVDLYSVLTSRGGSSQMRLAEGDRILVPLLGPTVAVSGLVRQPGIFELPRGQVSISSADLLQMAGGQEVRGLYRFSILRIDPDGRSSLVAVPASGALLRDSEILFVQLGANQVVNRAMLSGGSGLAGSYAIVNTRLSEMLRSPGVLGETPYSLFGLIVRRSSQTLMRSLIAFTPAAVLAGREDVPLQSDDNVRPFSASEARLLDFVIRSYLIRLGQADQALRNPLGISSESSAVSSAFSSIRQESEREREVASAHAYISNIPSQIQRNTIISLLDEPLPGSPLASARADQMRRDRDALALAARPGAAASVATAPGQLAELPAVEGANVAANFQTATTDTAGFAANLEAQTFGQLVRQLDVDPLVLINFLAENRVRLDGAVRGPGDYLIGPSASLQDVVQAAGGTVNWADQKGVELITTLMDRETGRATTVLRTLPLTNGNLASYLVRPGDQLRIIPATSANTGTVTVQGEVRSPGTFSVLRGDRLSDVLTRAGGLTEVAYPPGTVFLRQSAAQQEREGYVRAAREMQDQLVTAMTRSSDNRMDPSVFGSMQTFVQELRTQRAIGRISIVADPSILASRPELDPLLESGDVIYVPQRPATVTVLGQVLQPGAFPYRAGETIESYIQRAGGFGRFADEAHTFLVLPDGTARRWERSWFRFDAASLPPGSTIVVPRDVTPFDFRQTVLDMTQILSQLAVGIASVAVISKN
jgi:protein involved in polysaccharide export with SLBB domain